MEYKIINAYVSNPANNIFKSNRNDPAQLELVSCNNSENCQLFKNRRCTWVSMFSKLCPHGKFNRETGPTKRARSYGEWRKERLEKYKDVLNKLESPKCKFAYVGDWVYFPYSHADMNKAVPFKSHSMIFISGDPFIKRENWNLDTIKCIIDFHPYALCGGEITTYQEKEIPLFLQHLEENDNQLFNQLIQKWPEYIDRYKLKNKNYVGRKALLKTLNFPLTWKTDGYKKDGQENKYVVEWNWDGKKLKTNSSHAYNETWGNIKSVKKLNIEIEPEDNCEVYVKENNWVNGNTKFVD